MAFNPLVYFIIILLCLVISAFFSSSETALLRISSHQIQEDLKKKLYPAVAAVKELIQSLSRLLVTLLMGNTIVNILATAAASAVCVYYFGNKTGVIVATIAMTILVLIFGELLPKAIAAKSPKKVAYFVALPLYFFHKILSPFHLLFEKMIDPIVNKLVGGSPNQEHRQAYDSILMLARQMKEQTRRLTDHGSALPIIGSTARAAETTAEEIMIPKIEIVAADYKIKANDLLDRMLHERYTRVPIYKDNLDNILGLIHLKDLILHVKLGREDIQPILKPILRIPERRLIFSVLAEMQKAFMHVAIVKDQFGGTRGLLTQEDILEEIVGEIRDEFDKDELMSIQKIDERSYSVLGRTPVQDFNRETGWQVKSEKGDTLGGLVFNSLGRAPKLADRVYIGEYDIAVSDLSGNRITRVLVSHTPVQTDPIDEKTEH